MNVARYVASDLSVDDIPQPPRDSLFSSPGFADLWRAVGGTPVYWVLEDDDGDLAGFLPGVEFGLRGLRRFQAMPDGCYGGLHLSPGKLDEKQVICRRLLDAIAHAGYVKAFVTDFYADFDRYCDFHAEKLRTTLVDITDPGWQPPDKTLHQEIRKAEREGIAVGTFDAQNHMKSFLGLARETELRHGRKPRYPPRFYAALAELAARDDRVQWLWCEHDGRPAASHIFFMERDMIVNWQVYFDKAFSFLKPNQYILYMMAKKASQKGIRYLNLGSSPPDAAGLQTYKGKWGGKVHEYRCLYRKSRLGKLL